MTAPSPDAKHVRIGLQYRPTSFETRASDGTYASFMRPPNAHCERVQTALIGRRGSRRRALVAVTMALAVVSALYLLKAHS